MFKAECDTSQLSMRPEVSYFKKIILYKNLMLQYIMIGLKCQHWKMLHFSPSWTSRSMLGPFASSWRRSSPHSPSSSPTYSLPVRRHCWFALFKTLIRYFSKPLTACGFRPMFCKLAIKKIVLDQWFELKYCWYYVF